MTPNAIAELTLINSPNEVKNVKDLGRKKKNPAHFNLDSKKTQDKERKNKGFFHYQKDGAKYNEVNIETKDDGNTNVI